jgi:hypothetical protein
MEPLSPTLLLTRAIAEPPDVIGGDEIGSGHRYGVRTHLQRKNLYHAIGADKMRTG